MRGWFGRRLPRKPARSWAQASADAQIFVDALRRHAAEREIEAVRATAYSWGYHAALTGQPFDADMVDAINDQMVKLGLPRHQWYAALPKWARTLPASPMS